LKNLHIVVGTVTGTAQSVAEYINRKLNTQFSIQVHDYPDLDEVLTRPNQLIVFCVSNTGVGELPPRMRKVYVQITTEARDLSGLEYLIINLGDSSFKTYGKSGVTLDDALLQCGATNLDEVCLIDAMHERYPRQAALRWLEATLQKHGKFTD